MCLLNIAEQAQKCIKHEQFIEGDPDAFWMEWGAFRDMIAKLEDK